MDGGSSLRFDAAVGQYQTVSFSHTTASETDQLILEAPTSFDATIAGFDKDGATGDTIVGVGFGRGTTLAYTENANFSGGSLTLADGGQGRSPRSLGRLCRRRFQPGDRTQGR